MAKYSYELKKKVVRVYLKGKGGYKYIAKNMELPHIATLKDG